MTDQKDDAVPESPSQSEPADVPVLEANSIFQGKREIWIDHAGVRYRLRITRRNRLILQK